MSRPVRVICLGGGYVAIYLSRAFKKAIRQRKVDLTIVSRENYHTFHGFVAEMLTGRIQPGQIISPARWIFAPAHFHNAEIESIDTVNQTVTTSRSLDGREYVLPYDHLVVALGSVDDFSRYRGIAEHTWRLKTWADCFRVRNRLLTMLELAEIEEDPEERRRLLTFVVAGGGYAGVEVATEFVDYFELLAKKEYPRINLDEVRVMLVHGGDHLLPELGAHYPHLRDAAERVISGLDLEVRLNARIASATPDEAVLATGERIATRTIISCTGTALSPLLDTLPYKRDERGRLLTDRFVRVQGTTNVWAAGDCAAVPHPKGGTCPPLGIFALTEGRQIARNIVRVVEGKKPKRYTFTGLGDAVSLGRRKAVAHVKGVPLYGTVAWLMWRAFLLYFIPTWDRKVRLVLDWAVWPFIGRDIVNMSAGEGAGLEQALFEPGKIIIKQGDVGRGMYVITDGEVEVIEERPEGEELLAVLGPGEHFGEMAVFQGVQRTATVRARTPAQLLKLGRDEVFRLSDAMLPLGERLRERPGRRPAAVGSDDGSPTR